MDPCLRKGDEVGNWVKAAPHNRPIAICTTK